MGARTGEADHPLTSGNPHPSSGRRRHYAAFYGDDLPGSGAPLMVVHGNCQAEAIRVVIEASTDEVATVRIPPAHELERDDLPHLRRLLARATVLASQPVRDGYRDLPIGTADLAAVAPQAAVIRFPVIRYTGLHPHGAILRSPWPGDPPVVPYHDLRTILAVARGRLAADRPIGHRSADGFRAVARQSLDELRRREREGALVAASDLVVAAGSAAMLTVNHPGNAVLVPFAGRILAAAGIEVAPRDPGRTLLPEMVAPIAAEVVDALGFPRLPVRADWLVRGRSIADDEVSAGQFAWYADRPEVVAAALERYAPAIDALGLDGAAEAPPTA